MYREHLGNALQFRSVWYNFFKEFFYESRFVDNLVVTKIWISLDLCAKKDEGIHMLVFKMQRISPVETIQKI
jgi:hypothetical protein